MNPASEISQLVMSWYLDDLPVQAWKYAETLVNLRVGVMNAVSRVRLRNRAKREMGAGRPEAVPVGPELHVVAFAIGADVTAG